ncbi:hypothetical protein Csa_017153 [Cucumis sativus]|nr:hypothetical protein Csa_017153 [Cucumis sativus]
MKTWILYLKRIKHKKEIRLPQVLDWWFDPEEAVHKEKCNSEKGEMLQCFYPQNKPPSVIA